MGEGYSWRGCDAETGCCVALRTERNEDVKREEVIRDESTVVGWEGESEDGSFVPDEESESESEEDEGSDIEMQDVDAEEEETEERVCEDYLTLLRNLKAENESKVLDPEIFYPIDIEAGDAFEDSLWKREKANYGAVEDWSGVSLIGVEHIAGPKCLDDRGYNGHNISADKMKGSTTYQCLAYKSPDWQPESDDEEWEVSSEVFLTGIGDRFPSRDMASPEVYPARHGWNEGDADSWHGAANDRSVAMPFHPTCFDIFKRLSKNHLGKIDVHGLMAWRSSKFADVGRSFSSDPNVEKAKEQWWAHHAGDEYLAANPLYIPGLVSIFEAARATDTNFNPRNSAFASLTSSSSTSMKRVNTETEDPFLALPQELREHIIDYLDSREIAALRLSSRKFHDLPISLWYKLLKREMPWLWEVYSAQTPSFWTALEVLDLKHNNKEREEWTEKMDLKRYIMSHEMPEIFEEWGKDQPRFACLDAMGKARRMAEGVGKMLEREGTNWYLLYKGIRMAKLKGLRNRERIWTDVERIVGQIGMLREQGYIAE